MDESSIASVDAYITKELMPVTSIDAFITKSKSKKKSSTTRVTASEEDEGSMISVLTMDPTLQAISRREAELGPAAAMALYKPKKSKKRSTEPPGASFERNDNAELEETMMQMTNPYPNTSIAEDDEDDESDALSEIAPLDLVSL